MRKPKAPRYCFWVEDVLWGRQTIQGQKRRWSLRTDDPAIAAERVKADRQRNLTAATYGDARVSWGEAVKGWGDNYLPDRAVGEKTATRYAVSLVQINPWLRDRFVDEIDASTVSEIVNGRRKVGVTTATIRRDLGAMASVLTWCQLDGQRSDNPALDRVRLLKERRDPIVLPDPAHVRMVIERAPGLLCAMIQAAWSTGCRQDELVKAERRHLDHDRRELTVIGKGNKLRVIGLEGEGYQLLQGLTPYVGSKWLFWHGAGKPYRNVSSRFAFLVRSVFAAAYDAAHGTTGKTRPAMEELLEAQHHGDWQDIGFRTFRFHDLRHLHAVEWLRAGRSIYDLQGRLGHESITTTEMYLEYLTPEQARLVRFAPGTQKGTQHRKSAG